MALTIQSISDVERLLQQASQPYQAMSTKNARVDKYRDFLLNLLSNALGRELTQAELEIADIGFSFLNENELLPGLHSGGAQYNDVLSSLLAVNGPRGGSSYKDYQTLQQLSNLAYNTNTQINNNIYTKDGSMNFQMTRGLNSKLATQLSTAILQREVQGRKLGDISDTLSFGNSSSEMRANLERYVRELRIEADGELHSRLQTQIKEIEALEDEALIRFAYRTNAEEKIVRTDAEGNIVRDANGEIVYDTINHRVDPGFKLEYNGRQIQSEAEFAKLSDSNQRAAARQYRQRLIEQATKVGEEALVRDESGRVIDYYLYDDQGNRLQTSRAAVDEAGNIRRDENGNVIQESTDLRLSDVMQSFLQSDDARDAIKFGTKIRGRTVSQTSANILNEMLTYGDTTETVLKNQISEKVFQGMADVAENVRFISKAFKLQDMTQVEDVAAASGLGDILDTSNASKVRQQLEELKRMAIAQNRDIKDLFKERADLVEVLGVEYGGTQYVNREFTTNLHRIISEHNINAVKGPAGIEMKTQEEIAQEILRSRANAENVFGGFTIGQYAVNHMDHLSEETRNQINSMVQQGRQYLKEGDRERAHLISEDIRAIVNESVGGELSYYHNRQAQALYSNIDYELSVGSGLKVQLRDAYDRQFDAGVLGYSQRQEEMQKLWEEVSQIQSSQVYEQLKAIENDESLSPEEKETRKQQLLREHPEFRDVNTRNIEEDAQRVKEFREQEQKLLGDIVDITGSNEAEIQAFTGAYNKYRDITDNKVEYQGRTGREAAQEWLTKEYADTLRSQGYSEDLVSKNIEVMTRLYEAGTDGNKLRSYLVTQMANTGTIVQGSARKAQAWLEKFHEISNPGDKSMDMGTEEQIMAGLFGDGSGFLDEKEAIDIQYRRWLESKATRDNEGNIVAKEDNIESLQEFFRERGELGGAALGGYALETFIEGGSFGSKEDVDKFVRDLAEADPEAVLENGVFKGGRYKGLTDREAYNRKIAEDMLRDEEAQNMLKEIGVDVNDEASRQKFIDTVQKGGVAGLFREYLAPNGYDIMTAGKTAFLARRISSQQFSAELNKEFSNISKADFSRYLKGDSQIDSNEFMQLMTQMYGIENADMEELLTRSGMLDEQGRFGSREEAGVLAGKTLEEARRWFEGNKITDKATIERELGEGAYDKLISGDISGIEGFDSKTGRYMKRGSRYYGKTADQILTENISEAYRKAYIDSQYGEGTYEALTSNDPKYDSIKRELLDQDGKFKEGEFKGRTMDTVLAQFARGANTTDQQFIDFVISQTGKDIDLKATSEALQQAGVLNSEGRFKEGIFKGKTVEEANAELNRKGADGITLAERINNYRQSLEQTSSSEIAGTVRDLLTSTTSIESCLTDIKGLISDSREAPRKQDERGVPQVERPDIRA